MTNLLNFRELDSFDLLVKNLLNGRSRFIPLNEWDDTSYPIDIYTTDKQLFIEMPVVGADVKDIKITKSGEQLTVEYNKPELESSNNVLDRNWIRQRMTRKSFSFSWNISSKFDLDKLKSTFKAGLLRIEIPYAKKAIPQEVEILQIGQ